MRRSSLNAALGTMMLGITFLGVCVPSVTAQRGFASSHFAFNRGSGSNSAFRRGGSFFYPLPADGYYADALNAGYPVASQPPVVILQAAPAATTMAETHPGEPVLIELQGDNYVRVSGPPGSGKMLDPQASRGKSSTERTYQPNSAQTVTLSHESAPQQSDVEPKSAVLVFRDGHREEVSDYVIANGTLYAHTSYYTSGAWTKNIDLAALNVAETVSYNQAHGLKFQLPNASNEVIVGP
jgi:hypothetical protein